MSQDGEEVNREIVEMKGQLMMLIQEGMDRSMQGRKVKEKSKEEISELRQYSETGKYEVEEEHDKIIMSCAHQQNENQENSLERIEEKIDVKYNMTSDFKFSIVEYILQDEVQNILGNMFVCADVDKHGSSKDESNQSFLQEQEDERKQQDDLNAWNGEGRVFITLTQGIAKEKEDYKRCGVAEHEQILSANQGGSEDQRITWEGNEKVENAVKDNMDTRINWQSSKDQVKILQQRDNI
jgi:hypothetical protein